MSTTTDIIHPQQGQQVYVYLLWEYSTQKRTLIHAYTHKTQAEADMRWWQNEAKKDGEDYVYTVQELQTEPHNNHC